MMAFGQCPSSTLDLLPRDCHHNSADRKFRFQLADKPSIAACMLTDKDNLLRRLHALRSEHRDLDTVIARITEQGPLDQLQIQRLKKRKLGLKDEIAWLESRLIPDRTA